MNSSGNIITESSAFTVGQIAQAVGISRQAVHARLGNAEDSDAVILNGRATSAWRFCDLPIDWQLAITRRGVKRGFRNGEDFLSNLPRIWKSPVRWSEVPQKYRDRALHLQRALAMSLKMRSDRRAATADIERAALEGYESEFSYRISPRQVRRILNRTIERDAGQEDWERVEIYLDDRAFAQPKADALQASYTHRELETHLAAIKDRHNLKSDDRQFLWDAVFSHYERLLAEISDQPEDNSRRRGCKTSLIHFLFDSLPTMCSSFKSLQRRFEEKLVQWRAGGRVPQAIEDRRSENSGKFGRKLCKDCRQLVIGGAVDLDGDLSQAWRRLQLGRQLCQECSEIGNYDVRRNKSQVPKSVRAEVFAEIQAALPFRRGPKHVRLTSPYVRRDWSDIGPGDWAECDDMTPNHITHGMVEVMTWDCDEVGRPFIGRMEVLVQIDRRTDYPWAYVIILGDPATLFTPQRKATYNSVHCRLLFLRGHDQLGLPHAGGGFVLENGIWASRLIDGPKVPFWKANPWQSTEMGLKDPRLGLSVRHAIAGNPRSKVIERMFLSIQNRMRCQPGFVGFDERHDKRELLADFLRRVKAGKEHPGNEVPNISEFRTLLNNELMAHANEPQNGDRLPGVSPMEAFHNGISGRPGIKERPLRQLGGNARFLLSTHEREVPVTGQGIKFTVGGADFVFWGPELEPFQHRSILTRFNLEEPELITCQPSNGEPFTMKARILPSSTATKEQLQEAASARASWTRHGKVIYDSLPHPFKTTIVRDAEQSQETRSLGEFHNRAAAEYKAEKSELRTARKKVEQAGFDPNRLRMKDPKQITDTLSRIEDRFEALQRKEAEQS